MESSNKKIKDKVALIALTGLLSISGFQGTTFITQCFQRSNNIKNICVNNFLKNADPTKKLIYNLFILGGIIFGLITMYLFYRIRKDPIAMSILTKPVSMEDQQKRKKQYIRGMLWGIPIVIVIMIIAYFYVPEPNWAGN